MTIRQGRFLVVDDEVAILRIWERALRRKEHEVFLFENGKDALRFLQEEKIDVVLLDRKLPGLTGIEVLLQIKEHWPEIEVVVVTGYASIETALLAMKAGAYDYIQKPFEVERAIHVAEKALERKLLVDRNRELEQRLEITEQYEGMVGVSPRMQEVFRMVEQVSGFDAPILIRGETGTGKEQVARAIHLKSERSEKSFIPVVCGAIPENLFESTLFGHRKGAFTGAVSDKVGMIEAADGGTLFLDEVGDIPINMQVKLLRFLQEGEIQRVGDTEPAKVNVRVLAATHSDLRKSITEGSFREDLFFRLNLIEIELPPLRDRPADIPLLAHHFLRIYRERFKKTSLQKIDPQTLAVLQSFLWPGNVRQLEHVIARSVILELSNTLSVSVLPEELFQERRKPLPETDELQLHLSFKEAKQEAVRRFEKRYLSGALKRAEDNISQAARIAGMDRANFRRLLKKYELIP